MRVAGLILGILGAVAAGFLGMTWMSDYNEGVALLGEAAMEAATPGALTASYLLLLAAVVGIGGGIATFMGRGKIAGPVMVVAALLPAIFVANSLVFTSILLLAGILCFFAGRTAMPARQLV